jgi:hypothetical protein
MDGWKKVKLDNLSDKEMFKEGKYEFAWITPEREVNSEIDIFSSEDRFIAVMYTLKYGKHKESGESFDGKLYYRLPEPKIPSHEEICTKWWFDELLNDGQWCKVVGVHKDSYMIMEDVGSSTYRNKQWFTGRESATIPPEVNK